MMWLEKVSQMSRNHHEARELDMQISEERASRQRKQKGQIREEDIGLACLRSSKVTSVSRRMVRYEV